jgi:hypothetical protein
MLTIERLKQILNDPKLTDQQVEEIRDGFQALIEDVIFPVWLEEKDKNKKLINNHEYEKQIN